MSRQFLVPLALLGVLAGVTPAEAQQDTLPAPVAFISGQLMYARPVGEFHQYVEHGGGLNAAVVWPVTTGSPFALRADGGFIVYGSETQRVCFSSTVGCRVQLDLTTTNSIAYISAGPQLMVPAGRVRPYVNAGIGLSYFGTSSSVEGTNEDVPFASSTNYDDITFAWSGGGGVMLQLASGKTPIYLDIGARYVGNGEVEYLKKGDIQDNPSGEPTITPTRSEANLVQFQVGVTVGVRPGPRD